MTEAEPAIHSAEQAARASYGRLLAVLASRTGDVAEAEDALSDAFLSALETWPRTGVPTNPEGCSMLAAKRRLVDQRRHRATHERATPLLVTAGALIGEWNPDQAFPDERLKLLFVSAHPAIDPVARTPLMLQTVLGLSAEQLAGAFLVSPKTLGQRLWRAKQRIRDARIPFEVPDPEALGERVGSVLEAIYGLYGLGWEDVTGADPRTRTFATEAIWLARLVVELLPKEPEARGLLALVLFCESRRGARRSSTGAYVPLSEQDPSRWSRELIAEAERHLASAALHGSMGAFQLEAAIQSAHSARAWTGSTDWTAIESLARALAEVTGSVGARVAHAAAAGQLHGSVAALALLDAIPTESAASYQPYWALRAHLAGRAGRPDEQAAAARRAAGLTEDAAVRAFLLGRHVTG